MRWTLNGADAIDGAAACIFAAATAFAASALVGGLAACVAAPAFVLVHAGLRRVGAEQLHRLPDFTLAPLDAPEDARDDRVVRLFDPRQLAIAQPAAPGEKGPTPDAAAALSEALAQLKRSLR